MEVEKKEDGDGLPRFMKGVVKSTASSRSEVMVRSVMAKSASWKKICEHH